MRLHWIAEREEGRERERESVCGLVFEVLDVCAPQTDREPSKSGKNIKLDLLKH